MPIEPGTPGKYVTWLLALVGVWILLSPFIYSATISGAAMNNSFGSGIVVLFLTGYLVDAIRS